MNQDNKLSALSSSRLVRGFFWPRFSALVYLCVFGALTLHAALESPLLKCYIAVDVAPFVLFLLYKLSTGRLHDVGAGNTFPKLLCASVMAGALSGALLATAMHYQWVVDAAPSFYGAVEYLFYVSCFAVGVCFVFIVILASLDSQSGENKYGVSPKYPEDKKEIKWGEIIEDAGILMIIMSIIGFSCNLAMKPFEVENPTDSLISLIRKGGVENDVDKPFTKELANGMKNHEDFINTPDATGRTPLMWAVYVHDNDPAAAWREDGKRTWYVKTLMAQPGINLNAKDNDGFTALHWAAWSGMPGSTFMLTQGGLDLNAQENSGYTPLMLAALRGNAAAVHLLLELGADPTLKNAEGQTALDLATEKGNAYEKRDTWFFSLIYKTRRHKLYKETIAMLTNPPAKNDTLSHGEVLKRMNALISEADAEDKAEATEE